MEEGNHTSVERKIKSVVEAMNGSINYLFANWAQANVAIGKVEGPTIIYVLPASGDLDVSWREIKDGPEAKIAFVDKTEFDFDGEENDEIIERMKHLCYQFIKQLNESDLFEQIEGRVHYQVIYNHLDENITGILITLTIKEIEGTSLC